MHMDCDFHEHYYFTFETIYDRCNPHENLKTYGMGSKAKSPTEGGIINTNNSIYLEN